MSNDYKESQAQVDGYNIYMKDGEHEEYVRAGYNPNYRDGITASVSGTRHVITIPLDTAYPTVNKRFIREIGFSVGTFSPGEHSFTISGLRFIKDQA